MPERVLVTGAPGSGTTTLGRALADRLGAGFIDADDYFWLAGEPPYTVAQATAPRLASIMEAIACFPSVVVAGSVVDWGAQLEDGFSLVVYLWVPAEARIRRLIERETGRFGKPRGSFIEWAAQYDEGRLPGRSRAIHERWLGDRACPVVRIEGEVTIEQALARIECRLASATPSRYRGEGPGAITADGCAVDVYRVLPYRGELETIAAHLPRGCSVLELGCGTGRLTRRLLDRGHTVTAVDNSPQMLARVPTSATHVCCDIERLALGRAFDVALYASHLINVAHEATRQAQLAACHRHLSPQGTLIFQRFDPAWLRSVEPGAFPSSGEVAIEIERVERRDGDVDMTVRYELGSNAWRHHFTARVLDDVEVHAALHQAGFEAPEWIDERWGAATIAER